MLASYAERTVASRVAEVDGGGGTSCCASAVGIVPENPIGAEGRLTNSEGNGELPAGQDGGGIGTGAAWGRGGARVFVVLVDVPEAQAG